MKTTIDTTWYFPETAAQAEAEAAAEVARIAAKLAAGHLYVVEFTSGVVKVGKAENPAARLAAHARLAEIHGGAVKATWTSRRLIAYATAEQELIELCARQGRLVSGREYFAIDGDLARCLASIVDENRFLSDDEWSALQAEALRHGDLAAHDRLPDEEPLP